MGGNVSEWDDGVVSGSSRVIRGGGWSDDADYARSAYRNYYGPDDRDCGAAGAVVVRAFFSSVCGCFILHYAARI